jgi:hypothetical protein
VGTVRVSFSMLNWRDGDGRCETIGRQVIHRGELVRVMTDLVQ